MHFVLTFSHEDYGKTVSFDNLRTGLNRFNSPQQENSGSGTWNEATGSNGTRANAAFVVLARNSDLKGIVSSMKQMEDRFNKKYNYPWVFLNDEPFSDEFKKCRYFSPSSLDLLTNFVDIPLKSLHPKLNMG